MHKQIILGDLSELFSHITFFINEFILGACMFCMHFRKSYLHLGVFILPAFFKQYSKMDDITLILEC